jgi:hypothetical protein
MDRACGSRGWLSVHGGLTTMGQRSHSGAREVVMIARRERSSSGFSPMPPLGGGAAEMTTWRRSTEAAGGALMGR